MASGRQNSFYDILTAAVADLVEHGFDSEERVAFWSHQLREAAASTMLSEAEMDRMLRARLGKTYEKLVDKGGLARLHPGVSRMTYESVKPRLRAELDRRIMTSASLIKLNRREATESTLRRFQGWATSIPIGGSDVARKGKAKDDIRKSLAQLPFIERRVLIDQGHKFANSLSAILATDGGAIAARWRHHHVETPRPVHLARDGDVFLVRDSWAHRAGLVKPAGPNGYTDDIEQPGELVFCRCTYTYLFHLRDIPKSMLTEEGKRRLANARAQASA